MCVFAPLANKHQRSRVLRRAYNDTWRGFWHPSLSIVTHQNSYSKFDATTKGTVPEKIDFNVLQEMMWFFFYLMFVMQRGISTDFAKQSGKKLLLFDFDFNLPSNLLCARTLKITPARHVFCPQYSLSWHLLRCLLLLFSGKVYFFCFFPVKCLLLLFSSKESSSAFFR